MKILQFIQQLNPILAVALAIVVVYLGYTLFMIRVLKVVSKPKQAEKEKEKESAGFYPEYLAHSRRSAMAS